MRRCYSVVHVPVLLLWCLLGLVVVCVPVVGQANESVNAAYQRVWADRERTARTVEDRGRLAQDLLEAARATNGERAMQVHLCRRSYAWGSRDRANYHIAARAAERMQEVDSSLRVESLQMVRDLYKQAYETNRRTQLGMGVGMSRATLSLARQMMLELEMQRSEEAMSLEQIITRLRSVSNEYTLAAGTMRSVLASARSLARQYERHDGQQHERLMAFISEREPILEQIEEEMKRPEELGRELARLLGDIRRFSASQDREVAARIGNTFLIDLDDPDAALEYTRHYLPASQQRLVFHATRPMEDVPTEEVIAVGQWYLELANEARPTAKPAMLTRSHQYLTLASGQLRENDPRRRQVDETRRKVGQELAALHIAESDVQLATTATQTAGATPSSPPAGGSSDDATSTPRPTPPATDRDQPIPSTPPATASRDTERPAATTTTPAGGGSSSPQAGSGGDASAAAASAPRRRRTVTCNQCQGQFILLPGRDNTTCDWCQEGHRNIFDFNN